MNLLKPDDLPDAVSLAILDVCGAPAATARAVQRSGARSVVVLGAAGKSGCLSLAAIIHLDETKAFAAAGVAVLNDLSTLDPAVLREERLQALTRDIVTQISDIESRTH